DHGAAARRSGWPRLKRRTGVHAGERRARLARARTGARRRAPGRAARLPTPRPPPTTGGAAPHPIADAPRPDPAATGSRSANPGAEPPRSKPARSPRRAPRACAKSSARTGAPPPFVKSLAALRLRRICITPKGDKRRARLSKLDEAVTLKELESW